MSCLSATLTNAVFAYLHICVFVFVYTHLQVRHPGTLFLRSSYHYLFKNIAHVMSIHNFDQCCICVFVYLCICVFVFVYLQVRHPGILFLRSCYYYLFKNIVHVMSICNFYQCCICVFVYLQVRHSGTFFLRSLYHHLSENVWFVWSKTSYSGDKRRCYQAGRTTNDEQWKIVLLSLWAVGRLSFAIWCYLIIFGALG